MTAKEPLTDETDTSPAAPAIPKVMPWRYALTICAAALVLGIAGYVVMGSVGSMAATAGFAVGLFAALSGGPRGRLSRASGSSLWPH